MAILFLIILSVFFVSLLSFAGVFTLLLREKFLEKTLFFLVSLSAGSLMGAAFLNLIPEALEIIPSQKIFFYVLFGFFLFFVIEKFLHWRHCHEEKCLEHTFTHMNLFGDAIHNFIDGLIIATSFVADISLGVATTFAIVLHEIPQEISDFGVLLYGGFKKEEALFFNFLTAVTAVVGGILGYFLSTFAESFAIFLIPFAAGGFIYVAASDLLPEIRKETDFKKSLLSFIIFAAGILIIYVLKFAE